MVDAVAVLPRCKKALSGGAGAAGGYRRLEDGLQLGLLVRRQVFRLDHLDFGEVLYHGLDSLGLPSDHDRHGAGSRESVMYPARRGAVLYVKIIDDSSRRTEE